MPKEDKKKDDEKILEEIIVENFPKMGKEIITEVQETQSLCPWDSPGKNTGMGATVYPRGQNPSLRVSCLAGRFFTTEPPGKPSAAQVHQKQLGVES